MTEKTSAPGLHHEEPGAKHPVGDAEGTGHSLCRCAGLVKRQPAGKWSGNRPDASGIWREPAPHLMPCRDCGELTSSLEWCARCRAWDAFVKARAAGDREQAAHQLGMFRRAGGVL